ncbi:hypothetical protein M2101_002110 [Parabacteroides sp. PM5-20]|nr:hypothetical protein [Parabacteroides sp. PM5-20]
MNSKEAIKSYELILINENGLPFTLKQAVIP